MGQSQTSKQKTTGSFRRDEALDHRIQGKTYAQIGALMGISAQTAHKHVTKALDTLAKSTNEKAEQLRTIEHQRLEDMYDTCVQSIAKAKGSKRLVVRQKWVEQARKISESIRKLYGLDAPSRTLLGNDPEHPLADAEVFKRLDAKLSGRPKKPKP